MLQAAPVTEPFGRSRFFPEGRRKNKREADSWTKCGCLGTGWESWDRPGRRRRGEGPTAAPLSTEGKERRSQRIQHSTHKRYLMAAEEGWRCAACWAWFHSRTVKCNTKPHGCGLLKWHLPVIKPFIAAHYCRRIDCTWKGIRAIKCLSTFEIPLLLPWVPS